jgi:transposase
LSGDPEEMAVFGRFLDLLAASGVAELMPKADLRRDGGGRPPYDPCALLATVIFAFSDCGGSVRDINESCRYDIRYKFLMSGECPEKSAVCDFMNGAVLPNCEAIFAKVTGAILREMGVSPLDRVFIDGSKFEANANKYKFRFKSRKRMLSLLDRARTLFLSAGIPFPESPGRPFSLPMGRAAGEAADRLRAEGTDPAGIVTGRGRRLTPGERLLVEAERLLQRMLAYEETEAICGPSRDSYYRTDTDATAMCLKEDYYSGLGSNMHAAYNVQYAVSSGIIVGYYVSQDRSDSRTFPAFVDRLRDMWGAYPSAICADAGYGSLANYQYLRARGIGNFVKYPGWEGEVSGTRPAFIALSPDGALRCIDGKEAAPVPPPRHPRYCGSEFVAVEHCGRCPYMRFCRMPLREKSGRARVFEIVRPLLAFKEEAKRNLLSPEGIEMRVNRSIQVEGTFGMIKQDLGYDRFRRRGLGGAAMEMMLTCLGANVRKYFRFLRTGKLPEFWKAPEGLAAESPHRLTCAVRRGGRSRRNLRKQPNQVAKRMGGSQA